MTTLIQLLKSLPLTSYIDGTIAISYADICSSLKLRGFDNFDLLNAQLRNLESQNLIKCHCMDDFDSNLIISVSII